MVKVCHRYGNKFVLNEKPELGIDLDMDRVRAELHHDWMV